MITEGQEERAGVLGWMQSLYRMAQAPLVNQYPLEIEDKLYSLIKPGLYFTELSWKHVIDNLIYHRITIHHFEYAIEPVENSSEVKFRVVGNSLQEFAVQLSESRLEYKKGWTKGMVDGIFYKLMERIDRRTAA